MKKHWLPLVFAAFLILAPVASADDGSALGCLQGWIAQLVSLFVGDELGPWYPPSGAAETGDQANLGQIYPPYG